MMENPILKQYHVDVMVIYHQLFNQLFLNKKQKPELLHQIKILFALCYS